MRAMVVRRPGPTESTNLHKVERLLPDPGEGELSIVIEACGVCRTDFHVVEGDLPPRRNEIVPGHEVVGKIRVVGRGVVGHREGDRVGVAWLNASCGRCRFCHRGEENLCFFPSFTGWDIDGGCAEGLIARSEFVYSLLQSPAAISLAPLLCAGIIGYRAYGACKVRPGGQIGLFGFFWGFGSSSYSAGSAS